jgi:hypothetical protein
MAQSFGKAREQIVTNIYGDWRQKDILLASVLLDPVRACVYICAEYATATQNGRSQAKQAASSRLSPREIEFFSKDFRELEGSVASTFRSGDTRHIQTRGKDGSRKRKEKPQ